jgi:hypothetical protein
MTTWTSEVAVRRLSVIIVAAILGLGLLSDPVAKAEPAVEYLMVPSAAMARDIP